MCLPVGELVYSGMPWHINGMGSFSYVVQVTSMYRQFLALEHIDEFVCDKKKIG